MQFAPANLKVYYPEICHKKFSMPAGPQRGAKLKSNQQTAADFAQDALQHTVRAIVS